MDAILLSAGIGSRTGLNYPKQFLSINGKPMLVYSLEILRRCEEIEKIIVTCTQDYLQVYQEYIEKYHIADVLCVLGGLTRQESVKIALEHVKTEMVLIHEAARPLISVDFVNSILSVKDEVAVIPTLPVKFTVIEGGTYIEKELVRSRLHNVQLPQVFKRQILWEAHQKAVEDKYTATEDGMLVFHYGHKVRLVEGRESNIKVTTMLDIEIVEKLLKLS